MPLLPQNAQNFPLNERWQDFQISLPSIRVHDYTRRYSKICEFLSLGNVQNLSEITTALQIFMAFVNWHSTVRTLPTTATVDEMALTSCSEQRFLPINWTLHT
jgi:hypothetical protein